MSGFLSQVNAEAHQRVAEAAAKRSILDLQTEALDMEPPPSFANALVTSPNTAVIAEIKRRSPSRGHLAVIADPAALARNYEKGGAAAVSVLTEPKHFGGSLDDLRAVTARTRLPVLRKDFVVHRYQVWEARAAGAAAVLLIVAGLNDAELVSLQRDAYVAGLDCLIETHSAEEVDRAVETHRQAQIDSHLIIGVNARDLKSLEVDIAQVGKIGRSASMPENSILIGESGIAGPDDVRTYAQAGVDAVLVGEYVATAADPQKTVAGLVAATRN